MITSRTSPVWIRSTSSLIRISSGPIPSNGDKEIRSLKIAPEAIDPEDVEMLEDMLIAVFNEAVKKVDDMTSTEMGKLTSGLNLPKGML